MSRIDESRPFVPLGIAVLTVSDTRTLEDDKSGNTLVTRLEDAGHKLASREIVKDDVGAIQAQVRIWIDDENVDAVISTGGTGLTGRDITPEAMEALFEKRIDGFSTAFHMISYEKIGTSTVQSRAREREREKERRITREIAKGITRQVVGEIAKGIAIILVHRSLFPLPLFFSH
ncbi:MAG: MogA/MoaB family molybdenum cofactor biosynthesis protein [Pseudomonadota bacterium]